MKESIRIKNLGPIKDIFIDDIKPLTVLIGESGSGKSTLMKVIALFRWIYKMHNIRSYLKKSKLPKSPFRFRMDTYFKNCGLEQFLKKDTEIIYMTKFPSGVEYAIKFQNNKLIGTTDSYLIQIPDLQYNKISFIPETRNIIPLWADKGATLSGAYLGYYFHELYNDFILASERLKELDVSYLNLRFTEKKTQFGKKYLVKSQNEEYEIDLKNSSSGTQNAIPVSLIAEHFSKSFDFEESFNLALVKFLTQTNRITNFQPVKNLGEIQKKLYMHIEEPELSLYPDAQCELINDLISKCFIENRNEIELIFSTHSPYIINHLNLLIKAYDTNNLIDGAKIDFKNLSVYQIEDGLIQSLVAQNERFINTNPLSDTINNIYDKYAELK